MTATTGYERMRAVRAAYDLIASTERDEINPTIDELRAALTLVHYFEAHGDLRDALLALAREQK